MRDNESTWIVMRRDLSATVPVAEEPVVMASLVVEAQTGLVLGARVAAGGRDALAQALEMALTRPAGTLAPRRPDLVCCADGIGDEVQTVLGDLVPGGKPPAVHEIEPVAGAEDLFDSFVGHLAGRRQPDEAPESEDWSIGFHAAHRYREQTPWARWHDTVPLALVVDEPGGAARYLCAVLGADGVQRGLVAYPGEELPAGVDDEGPGEPAPPPAGTLMLFLDPPSELPPDLVAKARRYGWPVDDDVVPAFMAVGPEGPMEPSRRDLQHLVVAVTAVTAHDRRGPIVVGAKSATTGELAFSDGRRVTFSLAVSTKDLSRRGDLEVDEMDDEDEANGVDGVARDLACDRVANVTIDALFDAFLADQRARLAPRTLRKYETVVELFAACLNSYGHRSLDPAERRRWEGACGHDEGAFVHLFGADKLVDNLGEFLGYFMIRKVAASEDLLRAAGTVTKKLAGWLAEHGHLDPDDARVAAGQGARAGRDLPRAERLSRLLGDHARRSQTDVIAADDEARLGDYLEDHLTIDRVEPGTLWFEGGIGPVAVPTAASALAQPGWSLHVVLAHHHGRWQMVEVGNVHP